MLTFPKYGSYKDSGVEWLGKIPSHWEVKRHLGLFDERKEVNQPDMELLSVTIDKGVVRQSEITTKKDSSNEDKSKYKVVRKDDLAYNKMRMWQGAIGRSDYDGIVSPAYIILNTRNRLYSQYFHYLYRTESFIREADRHSYGLCSDMNSLRYEDFKTIYSPVPPGEEVERIVEFLDRTTTEIDRAISQKQRLIQLLQEQKAILINQAVTKGLNPNVPMRDSGIEWIGEIPEHWEMKRLKHIAGKFMYGTSVDCNTEDSGTPVLRIPNIETGKIAFEDLKYAKLSKQEEDRYLVGVGDILIVRTNGNPQMVGRSALISEEGRFLFASYLIKITPNKNISPELLSLILNAPSSREALTLSARTSAGNYNLNSQALGDIPIPYPPKDEQAKIIDFIRSVTGEVEDTISKMLRGIEQLEEFRSIFISNAVTGKIKV